MACSVWSEAKGRHLENEQGENLTREAVHSAKNTSISIIDHKNRKKQNKDEERLKECKEGNIFLFRLFYLAYVRFGFSR